MTPLYKVFPRPVTPVPRPPPSNLVTVQLSPALRKTLESRVERLRELLPFAGAAGPVLAAELARLQPLYDRVHRQLADAPVLEVPRGMTPEQLIAAPPELGPALAAVRDRQLERVRQALANRDNWSGGVMPAVVADALKDLKPGHAAMQALLNRSSICNAIRSSMVDFGADHVERWRSLRETLSAANHLFDLSL